MTSAPTSTTNNTLGRRSLIKSMGGAALVAIGSGGVSILRPGMAGATMAGVNPGTGSDTVIVTVFLRGGADGLNMVAPFGDDDYLDLRPTIGLRNGSTALPVNDFFSFDKQFHEAGAGTLFTSGKLAVVHASGSPATTRSHFSAMDNMDRALAPASSGGWLERALQASVNPTPISAYGIGSYPNPSMIGAGGARPTVPSISDIIDNRNIGNWRRANLQALHGADPWFNQTTANGLVSLDAILGVTKPSYAGYPAADAGPYRGLGDAAAIINADMGVRAVTVDLGAWDHHQNLTDRLPPMLGSLGKSLSQFWNDLSQTGADKRVVVMVMSEFGRTAAENGQAGTDHGHGNCMLVLGDNVLGGQVLLRDNQWPGLKLSQLYEGQDLPVTTDFRDVYAEVLTAQFGADAQASALGGYMPTAVGLFPDEAPTLLKADAAFMAHNSKNPEIRLLWGGTPPNRATGTVVEMVEGQDNPPFIWGEFNDITTTSHNIYKSRPNHGIIRSETYWVRVGWKDAQGNIIGWSGKKVVGPWR